MASPNVDSDFVGFWNTVQESAREVLPDISAKMVSESRAFYRDGTDISRSETLELLHRAISKLSELKELDERVWWATRFYEFETALLSSYEERQGATLRELEDLRSQLGNRLVEWQKLAPALKASAERKGRPKGHGAKLFGENP